MNAHVSRTTRPVSRKQQAGMTLIEMVVVIILIMIILAAAASRIGGVFGKSETADAVTNLNLLIVNTKTLRSSGGYGATGTDLVPVLIATNGVPKAMPVIAGKVKTPWNSDVTVASTGTGFTLTVSAVPMAPCIDLANKVSRGGAMSTKINANTAVTGEVPTVTASTQCDSPTSNTLVFTVIN